MTDKRLDADKMIDTSSSVDEAAIQSEEIDELADDDDDRMNENSQRNGDFESTNGAQPNEEEKMVTDEYAEDIGGPQMRGKQDEQSGDGSEHSNLVYEVEAVVGHRLKKGRIQYLIKWKGYPTEQNTWEYRDNVYCESLLGKYWDSKEELVKQDPTRQPTKSPPAKSKKSVKNQSSRKSDKRTNSRNLRGKEESDEDDIPASKPTSRSSKQSSSSKLAKNSKTNKQVSRSHTNRTLSVARSETENEDEEEDKDEDLGEKYEGKKVGEEEEEEEEEENEKEGDNDKYSDDTNDNRQLKKRRVDTSSSKNKSSFVDDNQMVIEQSSSEQDDEEFCPAEIAGSWEPHIKEVQTVQMAEDGQLMVYLNWMNGHTTAHSAKLVNAKCPQKIISFYENRLQFTSSKKSR